MKKPAPPPPPKTSPLHTKQQQHHELNKAGSLPEQPVTRQDSIKKPSIPPPGPPKSRPTNPPPPTPPGLSPAKVMSDADGSGTDTPTYSSNPFAVNILNILEQQNAASAAQNASNTSSLEAAEKATTNDSFKTHSRNASADLTQSPTLKHDPKGHTRARSHDYKLRQPPPVPQRTHSIPPNHSSGLAARARNMQLPPGSDSSSSSQLGSLNDGDSSGNDLLAASVSPVTSINPFENTIAENVCETEEENRERANSQSDTTVL